MWACLGVEVGILFCRRPFFGCGHVTVANPAVEYVDVDVRVSELIPYFLKPACPRATVAVVFALDFWVQRDDGAFSDE